MTPQEREAASEALRQLQAGDRAAAAVVFKALWPVMLSFSQRVLRDSGRAQDVAQEALMKLFQQAPDFRQNADAVAWALELVAWECRTQLRRDGRDRGAPATGGEPAAPGAGPELALEQEELKAALRETVGHLSEQDQAVIHAVLSETFPARADAGARKRKERALTRLAQAWRSLYGE